MAVQPTPFIGGVDQLLGGLATDQALFDATTDRNAYRIDDIEAQVTPLNNQLSAYYQVLNRYRKGRAVFQPKYTWVRDDVPQVMTRATAAHTAGVTTLSVVDATVFQPGMAILNQRTGEIMLAANPSGLHLAPPTMTSTTSIQVTRGQLGTVAAAMTVNDELVALGSPLPERGEATETNSKIPVFDWNYVSFWSTKVSVTELQANTRMRYGIDFPNQVRDAWFKLNRQVAMALMFSRRWVINPGSAGWGRYYFCNGLMPQIRTNRLNLSQVDGVLTFPILNHWLHNLGEANTSSPRKTLFCGTNLFEAISMISYNKVLPVQYTTTLGTRVMTIATTQGLEVDVVLDKHVFFGQNSGTGACVDMTFVQMHAMNNMPFRVRPNIQSNAAHHREDEIYGSASMELKNEECSGVIEGCVGGY